MIRYDVDGHQFDLNFPGGGVGQFDACTYEWDLKGRGYDTSDLGAQYGGFLTTCQNDLGNWGDTERTGYRHYKICIQCRENEIYKLHKKHTQNKYLRKKNGTKTFESAL